MISPIFLGAIAALLFINIAEPTSRMTYKPLLNDFISNHDMNIGSWKNNIKVNPDLNSFMIGSDTAYLLLSENKPIIVFLNGKKMSLDTSDTNVAINKLQELTNSVSFDEKKEIIKLIDLLLKYKSYYYFNKYMKYKNRYLKLKSK